MIFHHKINKKIIGKISINLNEMKNRMSRFANLIFIKFQ